MKANWVKSSSWVIFEYLWYPILVFATTPIYLKLLGAQKYGLWMLLVTTVGLGSVLNIGTGAATIKLISENLGRSDREGVRTAVRSSVGIALTGGSLLALCIIAVFFFGSQALFSRMGETQLTQLTGLAAGSLSLLEQLDNVFASCLKGAQKFGVAAKAEMSAKTLQIVAGLGCLELGFGIKGLFLCMVIISTARMVAKCMLTSRALGLDGVYYPTATGIRQTLNYAKWGWLQGIGSLLFGISDRLLVGSLLGAVPLAYYMLATQLAQQIHGIPAAGFSILFPFISRTRASRPNWSMATIVRYAMVLEALFSGMMTAFLIFFGRVVLTKWVGTSKADACSGLLSILSIAYFILGLSVVPHYVLLGLGRMRFISIMNIIAGIIATTAMYLFATKFALQGIAYGRATYGITIIVIPIYLFRIMRSQKFQDSKRV